MEIKTADEVKVGQTVRFPMADITVEWIEPIGLRALRFHHADGLIQTDREQSVGILADLAVGADHG